MPLRSVCSELLVRHCFVTLARYLSKSGISGTLQSHALVLKEEINTQANVAVCYFAVETACCDSSVREITCMAVALHASEALSDRLIHTVHHESEDLDHLDCPLDMLEALTPTTCPKAWLWRRRCLSMRFAEQYRSMASNLPYEPAPL